MKREKMPEMEILLSRVADGLSPSVRCSPVSAASNSDSNAAGCGHSGNAKATRTRARSSGDTGRISRNTTTSGTWTAPTFRELTSSPAGSRAKMSHSSGRDAASTALTPDSGASSHDWFARYDRDTCSWKMCQRSLLEGLDEFSETWPRAGTMRRGIAYPRTPSAPLTAAIGYFLLPTPTASDYGTSHNGIKKHHPSGSTPSLQQMARSGIWPTPTVADSRATARHTTTTGRSKPGTTLTDAVRIYPTPQASDGKLCSAAGQRRGSLNDPAMNVVPAGGQLNPRFVEWLQGFPDEWTACDVSVTPSSRKSRNTSDTSS